MGWSYRKSLRAGPFRINFSSKGVSYSVGVKGARINTGPRGTYVNLNAYGINYRHKISPPAVPPPAPGQVQRVEIQNNISSAAVGQLTDTDSQEFIRELNLKSAQVSYVKTATLICVFILLILFISSGNQEVAEKGYTPYAVSLCLAGYIPLFFWLKKLDKRRFEMKLHYEMDDRYQQVYQQFKTQFAEFSRSSKIWQYLNAEGVTDHKRNAGAGKMIKRVRIKGLLPDKMPLPYFITNVAIPCISLYNMDLYFLPERLLIKRGKTFAAVFYKNLHINSLVTNFIESEILPGDAKVIDYTWQFVNKNGGPDKRFNNNRKIPICAYSEYRFTSDTGVYEIIATSRQSAMDGFASFIMKIGELQNRMSASYR